MTYFHPKLILSFVCRTWWELMMGKGFQTSTLTLFHVSGKCRWLKNWTMTKAGVTIQAKTFPDSIWTNSVAFKRNTTSGEFSLSFHKCKSHDACKDWTTQSLGNNELVIVMLHIALSQSSASYPWTYCIRFSTCTFTDLSLSRGNKWYLPNSTALTLSY